MSEQKYERPSDAGAVDLSMTLEFPTKPSLREAALKAPKTQSPKPPQVPPLGGKARTRRSR